MKSLRESKWYFNILLALGLCSGGLVGTVFAMDNVYVSDVTPSSFSIIWQATESVTPDIKIYADADATLELTSDFEVTPFPLIGGDPAATSEYEKDQLKTFFRTTLQDKGLIKLQVEGLQPETTYYVKAYSVGTTETRVWPETGTTPVITPVETGFVSESRQLLVTLSQGNSTGWLVMAGHAGSTYGVSSYVGDGTSSTKVALNLANLFATGGSNWQPASGDQEIELTVLGGDGVFFSQSATVTFSGNFAVASVSSQLLGSDTEAAIEMAEPEKKQYTQGEPVLLSWDDTALNVNASISLYYDTDDAGEDGILIATGIEEDLDGAGDSYSWDTTGIADGSYFIYGVLNDGMVTVSDYAAGKIAIDRTGIDGDGDQMSDLWETLYFENLERTGTEDLDDDGLADVDEFVERTDPTLPDVRQQLEVGMNLVSIPLTNSPTLRASDLLTTLGSTVQSIRRIDPDTQSVEVLSYNGGSFTGNDFFIVPGSGYIFQMEQPVDRIFTGNIASDNIDLAAGSNLVGFVSPSAGYTAFQLLDDIGGPTVVSSIQRFDRIKGLFETAAYHETITVGVNFPIVRGEGYIITMREIVSGFMFPSP